MIKEKEWKEGREENKIKVLRYVLYMRECGLDRWSGRSVDIKSDVHLEGLRERDEEALKLLRKLNQRVRE